MESNKHQREKDMPDDKTEMRLKFLENNVEREILPMLREMHDQLIKFATKFNGGPGTLPTCMQHTEQLNKMDLRLTVMEKRFWVWSGIFSVFIFIAPILAPYLLKVVKHL